MFAIAHTAPAGNRKICQTIAGWPVSMRVIGDLIAAEMTCRMPSSWRWRSGKKSKPAAMTRPIGSGARRRTRYHRCQVLPLQRSVPCWLIPGNRLAADTLRAREWNDKLRIRPAYRKKERACLAPDPPCWTTQSGSRAADRHDDSTSRQSGEIPNLPKPANAAKATAPPTLSRRNTAQVCCRGRNPDPRPLQRSGKPRR